LKLAGSIVLVAALLAAAPPALAQPGGGRHGGGPMGGGAGGGMRGGDFADRQQMRERMREEHGDLRRDLRGEYWRQDSAGGRCDGPCRMTPEERRQLRRDIDDAGRTLYGRGSRGARD
jgi:hypothetical protein